MNKKEKNKEFIRDWYKTLFEALIEHERILIILSVLAAITVPLLF